MKTTWFFFKKGVLKNLRNFTRKPLRWSLCLIKFQVFRPMTLLKETPTQVFSCEILQVFKKIYFGKHLQTTASALPSIYKT